MKYIFYNSLLFIFSLSTIAQDTKELELGVQMDQLVKELPKPATKVPELFKARSFNLSTVQGISSNQLDQHQKLYQGYVKKRNEIAHGLQTVDRKDSAGITYSPFRALKVAETFALNGSVLHELYFEGLGSGTKPGKKTLQLIKENFGSLDAFKKDLLETAGCSRGWAIMCFNIDDGKVYNYLLDAHNETVPMLVLPLLIVDVYEHAYMIDFGINRAQYLDTLWKNINWDIVEKRIEKWVTKFKNF
ncbi:MAG: superoxide dismutase [Candidatus Dependentiae bacterium]